MALVFITQQVEGFGVWQVDRMQGRGVVTAAIVDERVVIVDTGRHGAADEVRVAPIFVVPEYVTLRKSCECMVKISRLLKTVTLPITSLRYRQGRRAIQISGGLAYCAPNKPNISPTVPGIESKRNSESMFTE